MRQKLRGQKRVISFVDGDLTKLEEGKKILHNAIALSNNMILLPEIPLYMKYHECYVQQEKQDKST